MGSWRRENEKLPHHDLKVWQLGRDFATHVYEVTSAFPQVEQFELTRQLRRAAVSIPSNIAEGYARSSSADFLRFLYMARGSMAEIDTQFEVAERLGYLEDTNMFEVRGAFNELSRALQGLIDSAEEEVDS
jgi:four helix bundle protein